MNMMSDPRFREVVSKFVARTTDDRQRLAALADRIRPEASDVLAEIGQLAHRLAGAAGTFGFSRLSKAARELDESVLERQAPEMIEGSLRKLLIVIDESIVRA